MATRFKAALALIVFVSHVGWLYDQTKRRVLWMTVEEDILTPKTSQLVLRSELANHTNGTHQSIGVQSSEVNTVKTKLTASAAANTTRKAVSDSNNAESKTVADITTTNPYLIAQSCSNLTESTAAFAQDIFENAEIKSLETWTSNNTHWQIPALDSRLLMQAFGGRRVSIVGDSSTAHMTGWINRLMYGTTPDFLSTLKEFPLKNAIQKVDEWHRLLAHAGDLDQPEKRIMKYPNYKYAKFQWLGFRGYSMHLNCQFDSLIWPQMKRHRPDILVVNWGLHMLYHKETRICNIYQWIHYESWLKQVFMEASNAGVKLLLFKTTNRHCGKGRRPTAAGVAKCREGMDQLSTAGPPRMAKVNDADKERYCREGQTNEDSVERLNQRLFQFVDQVQARASYSKMTVAVYNDHDLESCGYSDSNGVHFVPLGMPRIRLLAHMITCLYDKGKKEGNGHSSPA